MQPGLGIFLSHDPVSGDVMQPESMNGFNYVAGNPINAVDPTGLRRFRIWASAFIPNYKVIFIHRFSEFPGVDYRAEWYGDNRSFAWGDSTTVFHQSFSARVWYEIIIETDPVLSFNPVIYSDADTGRTAVDYSVFGSPRFATDKAPRPNKAAVSRDGCSVKVVFMVSAPEGSNPLERDTRPPAPPIEYAYYLRFDLNTNKLYIAGFHKKFPAYELYIASDMGVSMALVQDMPSGVTKTPLDLFSLPILLQPATVELPAGQNGPCGCQY